MPSVRPAAKLLLGALLLGAAGVAVSFPASPAWAEPATVFAKEGLIELVRPSDLVGDGATPADMFFLAYNADGTPMTDWRSLKLVPTGATATEIVHKGGGLYAFSITPAAVTSRGTVTLHLEAKLRNKDTNVRDWTLSVAPPRNHGLAMVANPAQMVLGTDKTANVAFNLTGGDPQVLARVKLVTNVTAGTFGNLVDLGSGQFTGLYTAPTTTTAQVALVTAVDGADPTRTYGAVGIPLTAKVDQAVTATPGASVLLKVGGRDFGPVPADSKGRAKVPIVVPPGLTAATLVQVGKDGVPKESPFDLKMPEARRVALFPTAASVPSDARLQIPVRAFVVTPDGHPDEAAQVTFTATAGEIGAPRHEGGGVYVATWTPPFGNATTPVTLGVSVGESKVQADSRKVTLVPCRATALTLAPEPNPLPAAATAVTVKAHVAGPNALPLDGRTLAFTANGAKLQAVKDLGNGDYAATFATTGKGPVEVAGSVAAAVTGNPLAHVLLLRDRDRVQPDGLSSVMLTVVTTDEFGFPVPNVEVNLQLLSGDGSLPQVATTNAAGVAQVYYTASRSNTIVSVEASAGDFSAGATFFQVPTTMTVPTVPVSTGAATLGLMTELQGAMQATRVGRGG